MLTTTTAAALVAGGENGIPSMAKMQILGACLIGGVHHEPSAPGEFVEVDAAARTYLIESGRGRLFVEPAPVIPPSEPIEPPAPRPAAPAPDGFTLLADSGRKSRP